MPLAVRNVHQLTIARLGFQLLGQLLQLRQYLVHCLMIRQLCDREQCEFESNQGFVLQFHLQQENWDRLVLDKLLQE